MRNRKTKNGSRTSHIIFTTAQPYRPSISVVNWTQFRARLPCVATIAYQFWHWSNCRVDFPTVSGAAYNFGHAAAAHWPSSTWCALVWHCHPYSRHSALSTSWAWLCRYCQRHWFASKPIRKSWIEPPLKSTIRSIQRHLCMRWAHTDANSYQQLSSLWVPSNRYTICAKFSNRCSFLQCRFYPIAQLCHIRYPYYTSKSMNFIKI